MLKFLLAGIGDEQPDLPGQRVLHVADQHKTTIGRKDCFFFQSYEIKSTNLHN